MAAGPQRTALKLSRETLPLRVQAKQGFCVEVAELYPTVDTKYTTHLLSMSRQRLFAMRISSSSFWIRASTDVS